MARPLRVECSGAVYHVTARGHGSLGLTTCDASYLLVAEGADSPLVTLDRRLRAASRRAPGR